MTSFNLPPLKIGDLLIEYPVGLAPMAGITDQSYREIAKSKGAGFSVSEMVSGKALSYDNEKTYDMLKMTSKEGIVGLQLFGSEADILREVVLELNDSDFDFFDINMGCPAPKIVRNHEGSALMETPEKAFEIVREIKKVSKKPVTVKTRIGFTHENINCVNFSKGLEKAGADAISIHGRTRSQYYEGKADWSYIKKVKEAVKIPVLGNGDIVDGASALKMLRETNCNGLLIGRGAQGNPWIFTEIKYALEGKKWENVTNKEKLETALSHIELHRKYKGEKKAFLEMRKHLSWYIKGLEDSSEIRGKINTSQSLEEMIEIITLYLK